MKVRPRHVSTRPEDTPIFTSPTGMDFEKRRIIFPPEFIDKIVLKGGDEYVKASDLVLIIESVLAHLEPVLQRIEAHLALGSDEDLDEIGGTD